MGKLHYFTILVFIILIAIASGSIFDSMDKSPDLAEEKARHVPDYFLQNFIATTMNKQGYPAYKVTATHLDHFPDDDSMKLLQPVFSFYENNIQTWSAQANEAVILQQKKLILLSGDVVLKQVTDKKNTPIQLNAEQLTIEPEQHRASTKSAIKLIQGNNHIQATGMRADMSKNRIEFLSNTRSHYVLPEK